MDNPIEAPQRMLHVLIGTPSPDDCPICKAHAPGTNEISGPEDSEIQIQELPLGEILRCPCPMCRQVRERELDR